MNDKTAIVLAGHGSHISSQTAGIVWRQVDALRALGIADEVTAAFWKEMPSFHNVLHTLTADHITVVPLFTAQGYFTQTVIPTEMGLDSAITQRNGKTIRYTRTLNEHPYLGQIVQQRVEDALAHFRQTARDNVADQIAVALIGHSTRRNPESRKATEAQADTIRDLGLVGDVHAVYLDDSPEIGEIYAMTSASLIIAVPYFLAYGSHTTIDVPRALRLEIDEAQPFDTAVEQQVSGRTVYYTAPVGIEDDLRGAILALIKEAGMPPKSVQNSSKWDGFPQYGATSLIDIGQIKVLDGCVLHQDDDLNDTLLPVDSPDQLRDLVRQPENGHFRSLATSSDLPRGWCVQVDSNQHLHAVIETIYPAVVGVDAAIRRDPTVVTDFDTLIERQTGQYRDLAGMSREAQQTIVDQVCSRCILHPYWFSRETPRHQLLCPEACNHWLSAALDAQNDKEEQSE
jgi:sirohydrochlorin cobaltochelatase